MYQKILEKAKVTEGDLERKSLFYILANNNDLYYKINAIYDFKGGFIRPECLEEGTVDFCGSSRSLVKLAFNLFNGYQTENDDPLNILYNLDEENFEIALKAIRIRFNRK